MNACEVTLGNTVLNVDYDVLSQPDPSPSDLDPFEGPEIELKVLKTAGGEDISGLLDVGEVYESILEKVSEYEAFTQGASGDEL